MLVDHHQFLAGDRHAAYVFCTTAQQWARRYVDDPNILDSIVQQALLDMTDRLRAGENPEPDRLVFWICTCTNNVVRRELRRIRRSSSVAFESQLHGSDPINMSHVLRIKEELDQVERALAKLDAQALALFRDRLRGDSYRELAATYEVSEGAARQSVSRTRKRLTNELDPTARVFFNAALRGLLRQCQPLQETKIDTDTDTDSSIS